MPPVPVVPDEKTARGGAAVVATPPREPLPRPADPPRQDSQEDIPSGYSFRSPATTAEPIWTPDGVIDVTDACGAFGRVVAVWHKDTPPASPLPSLEPAHAETSDTASDAILRRETCPGCIQAVGSAGDVWEGVEVCGECYAVASASPSGYGLTLGRACRMALRASGRSPATATLPRCSSCTLEDIERALEHNRLVRERNAKQEKQTEAATAATST